MTAPTIVDPTRDPADIDRARQALEGYLAALDAAEKAAAAARDAVRSLKVTLGGVPQLYLRDDRVRARRILERLPTPEEYVTPTHRHLRLVNGAHGRFTRQMAAELHRDGQVAEWLDGMPPEQPAKEELPQGKPLQGWWSPLSSGRHTPRATL